MKSRKEQRLEMAKKINNPNNEPTGPYTGRCSNCGSNDHWDDVSFYGCKSCKAMYSN